MRCAVKRASERRGRRRSALLTIALSLTAILIVSAPAVAGAATCPAGGAPAVVHGAIVEFGSDVTVAANERVDWVAAVGGDVIVHGDAQTAVAIGGDVIVDGIVRETIVAVRGNITLRSTATVGGRGDADNPAIVLIGGYLRRDPGARVAGDVTHVRADWAADVFRGAVWDPVVAPWRLRSVIPWAVQTLVLGVIALIVAVTMPRQARAVTDQLRQRPWAALGWGALTSFVILPVSIVILAITIIGLLIVIPGAFIGLPLTGLFAGSAVAILIGTLVLSSSEQRENLALAAIIGVAVLSVLRFVPFLGGISVFLAWLFGLGAIVLAIANWQRKRRDERRADKAIASSDAGDRSGQQGPAEAPAAAESAPAAELASDDQPGLPAPADEAGEEPPAVPPTSG